MNQTVKHTPGPWIVHEQSYGGGTSYSVGREEFGPGHTVARVVAQNSRPGVNRVNARLIAAAPELLDFACKARDFAREIDDDGMYEAADTVIAKAGGRS